MYCHILILQNCHFTMGNLLKILLRDENASSNKYDIFVDFESKCLCCNECIVIGISSGHDFCSCILPTVMGNLLKVLCQADSSASRDYDIFVDFESKFFYQWKMWYLIIPIECCQSSFCLAAFLICMGYTSLTKPPFIQTRKLWLYGWFN